MMLATIGNFLFRYRTVLFPLFLPLALLPAPTVFDRPLMAAILGFVVAAVEKRCASPPSVCSTSCVAAVIAACTRRTL